MNGSTPIEQLQKKENDIRNSLDQLKTMTEASEKEESLNKIKKDFQELNDEILAYKQTATEQEKQQLSELESNITEISQEINKFSNELNELKESVGTGETPAQQQETPQQTPETQTPQQQPSTTPQEGEKKEDKSFWQKTKDFVGDQWDKISSRDRWKEEPGKNSARVLRLGVSGLGIGLAGYGIYRGVKGLRNKLFGKKKNNETLPATTGSSENKSFWKTGWGKFLKWTGITAASGGAIYLFGKRLHLRGDKDKPTDTDRDQVKYEAYDKFAEKPENKEAVENYEDFGFNVDQAYEEIYKKELNAGYQDELAMDKISKQRAKGGKQYLGIVPFCLDNKFGTVEGVLSQNTSMKNALSKGIKEMVGYIKGLGNDFLKTFATSYLAKLPSWTGMKFVGNNLSDQIDKWIASREDAKLELQYFFRQSIRVQTYLFEKRDQLEDKIATEKAAAFGMTKEDILNNDENYKEYIEKDGQYSAFLSLSIANGSNILKNKGIFDASIGENVTESVKKLDQERAEIVGEDIDGKDILQIINEKEGKNVSDTEKQQLIQSCDNIIKDVDKRIKGAVKTSAWNAWGDLFASDDSAMREYWKNSGIDEMFNRFKTEIGKGKVALKEGRLNEEEIKALAESVNNMLALKKEAILGRNTIQKDRDENGNIIFRIPGFLIDSWENLGTSLNKLCHLELGEFVAYFTSSYLGAGATLYIGGKIVGSAKNPILKFGGKLAEKAALAPIKLPLWVVKKITRNSNLGYRLGNSIKYGTSRWIEYRNLFTDDAGPADLLKVFKSGDRNLAQATNILKYKIKTTRGTLWRDAFGGIESNMISDENFLKKQLFNKFLDDIYGETNPVLKEIRKPELFQEIMEYYDQSPELRRAIKSKEIDSIKPAIENQKRLAEAAAQNGTQIIDDVIDEVKPTAEILNDISYKNLTENINKEIKQLEDALLGEGLSDAEKSALKGQIDEFKALKNKINSMTSIDDIKVLENLYKKFSDVSHGSELIHNMDLVTTLMNEKNPGINQAIKEMDREKLVDAVDTLKKEGKLSTVTDDILTPLLDVFDVVEAANSTGTKSKVFNTLHSEMLSLYKDLKAETNEAKRLQIINQIRDIKKRKAKVKARLNPQELSSLESMFSLFSNAGRTRKLFSNLDTFTKLISEGGEEVETIIKNLNFSELKNLKANGKLTGITNEALESVTEILSDIKMKNALRNGDDIIQGMKNLIRIIKSVKNI